VGIIPVVPVVDPQPEGHMASHIERRKLEAKLIELESKQ
jgi:hypothetical protein